MAKSNAINVSSISSVIVTDDTGVLTASGAMTDGQVIIGSTGATPAAATLTAGTGITITPGAGAITIAASGGGGSGGLINVQYLTTSGTYTATAGTVSCYVIVVAGGGGGGGSFGRAGTGTARVQSCYGGQGSGYGMKYYAVAPTGTAYTVGAGGAGGIGADLGGSTNAVTGSAGGESTFNAGDIIINGANPGGSARSVQSSSTYSSGQLPVMNTSVGSASGVGNNADITANGGYAGFISGNSGNGGSGGASIFGMGASASSNDNNGNNAVCYGSGGGGTSLISSTGGTSPANDKFFDGGNGAPGIIVVYEYGA